VENQKMCRPLTYIAILVPAFFAIGCSEKADGPPTGPEFHIVIDKFSPCDVSHIDQLANSYFSPPRKQTVKNLVNLLATQSPHTLPAKNSGFDIMAQMEGAMNDVPATAGDPTVGSDLVNHLLLCMYDPASEAASYPASFPDTFTVALNPSLTGAFGHRTSKATPTSLVLPVYARSAAYTLGFSGIAPVGDWGVTNDPSRVVFYGRPATTPTNDVIPDTYDWRTIPHNATFNPEIVIAVCKESAGNTLMLNEQGVAILSFVDATFLDPASCAPSNTALLDGSSPFQLAGRLLRFGTGLLTPSPLMAAVLSPGGTGGLSGKCCSKVGTKDVPSVALALSNVTTPVKVNSGRFSLTATTTSGTDPVNGVKVTLATTTNNGTPTSIRVVDPGVSCSSGSPLAPEGTTGTGTNPAGTYTFNNLCFTNTGTVYIVGTADVKDRLDIVVSVKTNKINVKP
jgi:hypothetical protein